MTASPACRLIVNADDLGMHPEVDAGILDAHDRGIVTSTSLMVRGESAASAARGAVRTALSVGLHLDLSEWEFQAGRWRPLYERVDTADAEAVAVELSAQLELFRDLVGSDPTHLDSHQHVHREEPVRASVLAFAAQLEAPVRGMTHGVAYRGDFYGQSGTGDPYPQGITPERLLAILRELPPGVTELGCHPGRAVPSEVSAYGAERAAELETLCDPRIQDAIRGHDIELISFSDVRDAGPRR